MPKGKISVPLHSLEELRALLDYDPDTGIFRWRERADVGKAWNTRYAGTVAGSEDGPSKYLTVMLRPVRYKLHRIAWLFMTGEWPKEHIDHINGNTQDNRFANLREATRSQNMCNSKMRSHNQHGLKGVDRYFHSGKWVARIRFDNKRYMLGPFDTKEEAAAAYAKEAEKYHGEFARVA